jgi:hypothetical protein
MEQRSSHAGTGRLQRVDYTTLLKSGVGLWKAVDIFRKRRAIRASLWQ